MNDTSGQSADFYKDMSEKYMSELRKALAEDDELSEGSKRAM